MVTRLQISDSFLRTVSSWFPSIKRENHLSVIQKNQDTSQNVKKITPRQNEEIRVEEKTESSLHDAKQNYQMPTTLIEKSNGIKNYQKVPKTKEFKSDVLLKPSAEKRKLPLDDDSECKKTSLIKKPKLHIETQPQERIGISKTAYKNARKKMRMLQENLKSANELERNVLLERIKHYQSKIDLFNQSKPQTMKNNSSNYTQPESGRFKNFDQSHRILKEEELKRRPEVNKRI